MVRALDYKSSTTTDILTGKTTKLTLPVSDVIQYYTEDGSKISVRPSGTEPKIKFYISVHTKLNSAQEFDLVNSQLDKKIKSIEDFLLAL